MDYLKYELDEIFTMDDFKDDIDNIFNLLVSKEINKAMILKDKKSKFVLLHLNDYESLVKNKDSKPKKTDIDDNITSEEISTQDLQKALEAIENLDKIAKTTQETTSEETKDKNIEETKTQEVEISIPKVKERKKEEVAFWE